MQTFDKPLKLHKVIQKTGLTRDEITQKINNGTFPKPFKLNKRTNAWRESQINEWRQKQTEPLHSILKKIVQQKEWLSLFILLLKIWELMEQISKTF
jgi:predicted DNA-binding transcriptional regulator AlpA